MTTITLDDASTRLPELIHGLAPGEVLVITENDQPIAQLTPTAEEQPTEKPRRKSGTMKGTVLYMAEDFDAPLEEFEEYM